jgi:hypothetical protein
MGGSFQGQTMDDVHGRLSITRTDEREESVVIVHFVDEASN